MRNDADTTVHRRRGARELLVMALYQWQLAGHSEAELCEQFAAMPEYSSVDRDYFREVLALVLRDTETLDREIARHANRNIDNTDAVSRAVLLLGLAELHGRGDVPTRVIINESVELAKQYGPVDCYRFVNAVLDRAAKQVDGRSV
ncbi:MAG: transcription antitermination factor NusB [Rhodospirillaceae bacterium]|nr:transcription antitermination factor NusB [Rhodospirillaceae bacterium]